MCRGTPHFKRKLTLIKKAAVHLQFFRRRLTLVGKAAALLQFFRRRLTLVGKAAALLHLKKAFLHPAPTPYGHTHTVLL